MAAVTVDVNAILRDAQKDSENWSFGQKVAGALIMIWAAGLLVTGGQQATVLLAAGLAIVGVSFLKFGQSILRPRTIMLRDKEGRNRAILTTHDSGTFLGLFNANGEAAAYLSADDRAAIFALSVGGKERVVISCVPDGSSMSLRRDLETPDVSIGTSDEGGPLIELLERNNDPLATLTIEPDAIFAKVGNENIAGLFTGADGSAGLALQVGPAGPAFRVAVNPKTGAGVIVQGERQAMVISGRDDPKLVLTDTDGKPIREADFSKV